ncbi:MAG: hypothetical protein JSS62_07225 [Verrucomicrobia bacterium]|nr:hypothetical protein [Verrucomicrobiota bacterium]
MFLQPRTAGAEFEVLSDEACSRLPGDTKIVVVNAIVRVTKAKAAEIFMTHGFSTTILAQAAIEPPYEPKSQLADVRVPEAVREIMKYQEKDKQIGSFMTIDHIYFNTLAAELKK